MKSRERSSLDQAGEPGKMIINILFGGLDPKLLLGFGGLFGVLILLSLIVSSVNPSTLFNSESTKIEDICKALEGGFIKTKRDARGYIADYVNSAYRCQGSIDSISQLQGNNSYVFSTDACEISIDFKPELSEFAAHIDAHANAVNSSLQFFEQGGSDALSKEEKDVTGNMIALDEEGKMNLNDYGRNLLSGYDSEYANNQSKAYFNTLSSYSRSIFDYEKNTSEWIYNGFYTGKKEKEKTICYKRVRQFDMTYKDEVVACELEHNSEKTEIEYVDALFGHISVPMRYDLSRYKKSDIESTVSGLIGQQMYLADDTDDVYEKKKIESHNEANRIVENIISDYELSYLLMYLGGEYGQGYSGLITSHGFNYLQTSDDKAVTAAFWAYSDRLDAILHTLPYKSDLNGSGPVMTHQCTQFAATFFYDVYGFAALRGNGNMQADNLLKDCGKDSGCPVRFERASSPAPGAIVSLYPNHVIVVDQVDENGTVYISEGNYNGNGGVRIHQPYSSLSQFVSKNGYAIKTIAIPIR